MTLILHYPLFVSLSAHSKVMCCLCVLQYADIQLDEGEAQESPSGLNTIKVTVEWHKLTGRCTEDDDVIRPASLLGPLDEVLHKGISSMDAIGLGMPQPSTEVIEMVGTESAGSDILTFVFHYAPPGG